MSQPQNGRDMDRPSAAGGSVRRARERAQAGLPPEDNFNRRPQQAPMIRQAPEPRRPVGGSTAGQSRLPRPQAPAALQNREGGIGTAISRPTQIPQWPLPGPIPSPASSSDSEPYRPPPGRSQAPQRPPRPSRVPSILDSSRIQDHTPVFQYQPQIDRDSTISQDPTTPSSRPDTISSTGSIPDFPMPVTLPPPPPPPVAPPRRSVGLGPPPSARRGASSFYSNASFVSPIPEESPRSRSHASFAGSLAGSFASSAAMPESWGTQSPGLSPHYPDAFFEDNMTEDGIPSQYEEGDDESRLVRSASIGKRGKPAIVMNRGASGGNGADSIPITRPAPTPMQRGGDDDDGPFSDRTAYLDISSSSSGTLPTIRSTAPPPPVTAGAMLGAFAAASAADPADIRKATPSPRPFNRFSAIRQPPKLDMDSVKAMESRGSMTSLPDLIRRATRLAAMMDRGRRPASRFDDLNDWPDEKAYDRDGEKEMSMDGRHQSGFSDMLAAFPPPAATRQSRGSWFARQSTSSWPLAPGRGQTPQAQAAAARSPGSPESDEVSNKKRRRCCGLPLWGILLLAIVLLGIIAAAIIVPLEFFVFRRSNANAPAPEPALSQCQNQLQCENGGTNVISQGICSCICTNGFTGATCTVAGAEGCTTTNLVLMADDTNIDNVTLGQAIPRLIQQAQTNFTVPLSGTAILAKFNTESLSCIAQNSLVTFDGRSTRMGDANSEVIANEAVDAVVQAAAFVSVSVITVLPGTETTITLDASETGAVGDTGDVVVIAGFTTIIPPFTRSTLFLTFRSTPTPSPTTGTTTVTVTTTLATPTATFTVTEEVLDFARVAVLFILQQETLQDATTAQTNLQRFFSNASQGSRMQVGGVTQEQAVKVDLGGGNSVDLVHFLVDVSGGRAGRLGKREMTGIAEQVNAHQAEMLIRRSGGVHMMRGG